MNAMRSSHVRTDARWGGIGLALLGLVLLGHTAVQAQTAQVTASLGNFDVVNYTTHPTHGYEVEIEGASISTTLGFFTRERYGAPRIVPTDTGIIVRYESSYNSDTHEWAESTVPHEPGTAFVGTCYSWNQSTYRTSGCEHFGIGYGGPHGKISHRWLIEDPNAPGTLIPYFPEALVASPQYFPVPAARAGEAPELAAEVEAPEPPEVPELYGNAQWMKTYVQELPFEVTLDELVADNPLVVPLNAAQLESDWDLLQAEPASGGNGGQNRTRTRTQGSLDPTTQSVVRRYELYNYTGPYDPTTHEALCADLTCTAPSEGELGDFLSANMVAAIVQTDSVAVVVTGGGKVESSDKLITCPNKCVAPYEQGTAVTLTAKADSGSTFAGWFGDCTGTSLTCTVNATGHRMVEATFTLVPKSSGGGGGGGGSGGGSGKGK